MVEYDTIINNIDNDFARISSSPEGVRYLKIKTLIDIGQIKKSEVIKNFLNDNDYSMYKINTKEVDIVRRKLFISDITNIELDNLIKNVRQELSEKTSPKEIMSKLHKVTESVEYWNGWNKVYRDDIRAHIQRHYVKELKLKTIEDIINKIDADLKTIIPGYTVMSWYNQNTSSIIEDMFMNHKDVVPTIRKIKYVDFFIFDVPVDLKVTSIPKEYLKKIKRAKNKFDDIEVVDFIINNPLDLAKWLYENQGAMRFDDSNRLFLILVDKFNISDSWKLKSDYDLIKNAINNYLLKHNNFEEIEWSFKNKNISKTYRSKTDVLFIIK